MKAWLISWLKNRARESTTWVGILGLLSFAGIKLRPDLQEAIVSLCVVLCGGTLVVLPNEMRGSNPKTRFPQDANPTNTVNPAVDPNNNTFAGPASSGWGDQASGPSGTAEIVMLPPARVPSRVVLEPQSATEPRVTVTPLAPAAGDPAVFVPVSTRPELEPSTSDQLDQPGWGDR